MQHTAFSILACCAASTVFLHLSLRIESNAYSLPEVIRLLLQAAGSFARLTRPSNYLHLGLQENWGAAQLGRFVVAFRVQAIAQLEPRAFIGILCDD
jgi:hypothetical protein